MKKQLLYHLDKHRNIEGAIKVSTKTIDWLVYFKQGKIVYATNSLQPFERLERHLKRLSHDVPSLNLDLRSTLTHKFANSQEEISGELKSICWLLNENYIDASIASGLVLRLCDEVIATQLLLLEPADCDIKVLPIETVPKVCSFEPLILFQGLNKRLSSWQALGPLITSPFQRPFLSSGASNEVSKKLSTILRGFCFRQLSAIHNEDEIIIIRKLYPLIERGIVTLRPPQNPFDLLPNTCQTSTLSADVTLDTPPPIATIGHYSDIPKTWKIVCVDDSEAMLKEIKRLLADETLEVSTINDPKKAMLKIKTIKPDLILMDVGMPGIDGYQLCALLRKSSNLKSIPIVMVTGNKGLIDRARARIVGATDYLTKPFSQEELTNMVFRYLS